jgi:hypothetical protein
MRPKLNLGKVIMENEYFLKGKHFEIQPGRVEFRMEGTFENGSLFINILIKKIIIEWYFVLFLSCFICVISEVRINYDKNFHICTFNFYFLFLYLINEI